MRKPPPIVPAAGGLIGMVNSTLVGFDCHVDHPLARNSGRPGMMIGTADTAQGPRLIVSIAHEDGSVNSAILEIDKLPGFVELMQRQVQRVVDMATPAEGDTVQ